MSDHQSFCKSVHAAKTYREINSPKDPQLFRVPVKYEGRYYREGDPPAAIQVRESVVYGTTYVFPWSKMLPTGVQPLRWTPNVYIRFWYDEKSGEMRVCYLKPHQVLR